MNIGRAYAVSELESAEAEFRGAQPARPSPSAPSTYLIGDDVPDQLRDGLDSAPTFVPVTWYDTRKPAQGPRMWAADRVDGTVLAVRVDRSSELRSIQALDRHMRYAALAVLAAVVPLTVLAAELVLRRLRRVAGTARRIKRGDLDALPDELDWDELFTGGRARGGFVGAA
ncbi:hypothetical protein NRF20_22155 [Streptomyces sp. R-74717]|uniref:hypothetical protein n=1 Tax=Streptomyces TaxID=1883 RepID=UPI00378A5633